VENRAGAAGIAAAEAVAKSPPDGYALLTAAAGIVVFHKLLYKNLPYDPQRDLAPVSLLHDNPIGIFVNASVPVKSVQELIAYAKANPGKLNYASSGQGQPFHLGIELFQRMTGTRMVHIPYKGAAQFIPDLLAGRVQLILFPPVDQVMALVKAGKINLIAVDKRTPELAGVPTFADAGMPGFGVPSWVGTLAPGGTPKEIVDRLNREVRRAVDSPAVNRTFTQMGAIASTNTADQYSRLIASEIARWADLVASLGIELD
jgi:tripartite-type tricarboxylate transporter receptor subunit TctC